jgi:dihydropteroate synthase
MEYHEAVNQLERLRRLRPKLGTDTTAALLAHHGNPHADLTAVQIAGSNGKGSTASLLDSICREAGLRVGLYTSPDLNDLRERIRVGGQKIPKREVARFVEETWPYVVEQSAQDDAPTFFEAFTALALWHFGREDVDVAILEVGIGGRYDATSVVDPVAAAVTTVTLEHTDILGSTVEEIARDKVHVAPSGRPLVTGATGSALEAIRESTDVVTVGASSEVGAGAGEADAGEASPEPATDVRVTEREMVSATQSSLSIAGEGWSVETHTPLLGAHQAANAGIAAALARQVADPSEREIAAGIRNVYWPGRFELMERRPRVVLDGAHNPDASDRLAALVDRFEYDDLYLVFGAMRDKDHAAMARALPAASRAFLAEPDVSRADDAETLGVVFDRETDAAVTQKESVLGAVDRALRTAGSDDFVLVTGSLYTVAEARDRWTRTPTDVRTPTREDARAVMESSDVPRAEHGQGADRLVHRTVRLHARRREARRVKEAMLSLGGYCAVSGIETADQHVQLVLAGTIDQFRALVDRLGDRGEGSRHLARQLDGRVLGGDERESRGYPWENGTAVMGILNVTPDSFHDGGTYFEQETAVSHARELVEAGADIVDVGGESTRPGADPIPVEREQDRVVPVVDAVSDLDATISIDTRKPAVAEAALEAGADVVNDVTGLADARMRDLVAEWDVPAVLMHSLSTPVDPDRQYEYDDVASDVLETLTERVLLAERAGIDRSQLVVDPGLGFGKRAAESFELLDRLGEFRALGTPVMVGHSQKSMFASVSTGDDRLVPTVAATALAVERGADVVRVHDVPENVAAVATATQTVRNEDHGH